MNIVLGNFLIGIGQILGVVINLYFFLLLGRVIVSWVNADPYNPLVRFLLTSTEPVLKHIRKRMPFLNSGIDLSPMVFLLLLYFLNAFLVASLLDFGFKLKQSGML